jgi:DUF971 family protein
MDTLAFWPLDVVLHQASGQLELLWNDGAHARLAAAGLRAACRCSQCESLRRGGTLPAPAADLMLADLRPVGDFGLQLCFADGHDRGIYPWPYLRELSLASPLRAMA